MAWGEQREDRITVLICKVPGCRHRQLGAEGLMSARFCPEHPTAERLTPVNYIREPRPAPRRD